MTMPREVIPGRFYMITRRCTQRQFLMRPDKETNNAFAYCLADAARRTQMEVLLPSAISNHHHTIIFDRFGNKPDFTAHLHREFAKSQNALRGRRENFWAPEQSCDVELIDFGDVISKIVYAATNPVKDGLVDRVHHWPGFNGLGNLLRGEPIRATRPRYYYSEDGVMPDSLTLELTIPPELGDREEVLREIRERVEAFENQMAEERMRTGRRVLGRSVILRQSWRDSPTTFEPRSKLRPQIAARSVWSRLAAIQRNREFVIAYRAARKSLLAGVVVPFPPGTYWLRRFANVPIATDSAN